MAPAYPPSPRLNDPRLDPVSVDGSINAAPFVNDPVFGFEVPTSLPGVPSDVVNPRDSWSDVAAYDAQRLKLAQMFKDNFTQYTGPDVTDYSSFGPN